MKFRRLIIPVLIIGLVFGAFTTQGIAGQKKKAAKKQEQQEQEFIPKEIKAMINEGIEARTPRMDIPFDIFKLLYLRTSTLENLQAILFFECKNADLGFKDMAAKAPEVKEEQEKEETPAEAAPIQLQASNNLFLYFKHLDGKLEKEVYIPFVQQVEGANYDPEAKDYYTVGYPLPAGDYLVAMAISSLDLQKAGIQYYEFSLPNPTSFKDKIEITPVFFVKSMNRMSAVEVSPEIHKGFFTYSVLQITPNLDHAFAQGENLDIFFFVFGAQPRSDDFNKVDLEITYQILMGEEPEIRWAPQKYEIPIISQPLPMKKTVIIQTTDEEGNTSERTETRDLEPGSYTFSIQIKDNQSGLSTTETLEIEVK